MGSGLTAKVGAGTIMGGSWRAGFFVCGGEIIGATGAIGAARATGAAGAALMGAAITGAVESCTLSASKSMAAVISTPLAVRRVARITALAPRLSRTARSACLMSGPVWRVIFI
jgi:hypothetical protein